MSALSDAVSAYAARMHRGLGASHHVASPFGAWLLLALVGDPALEPLLGMPADEAAATARALLADPHPVVRLGAAAWRREEFATAQLRSWLDSLASHALVGDMPSQSAADAWARERTGGLIDSFPVDIDADTALVLATAVACAISWQTHFTSCPASAVSLPRSAGFDAVGTLLHTPAGVAREAICETSIGLVAMHSMPSTAADLLVVSVIADPSVPASDVLAAAHEVACGVPTTVSLFEVPLGPGHSWTLTEEATTAGHDQQRFDSVLPAWSAESDHDLRDIDGFAEAAETLIAMLKPIPEGYDWEARQSAMARYTRTGFEAAAVTALGMRAAAAMMPRAARLRTAHVEFTHPYAVVAVANAAPDSMWTGVPLFSAWVTQADEVD